MQGLQIEQNLIEEDEVMVYTYSLIKLVVCQGVLLSLTTWRICKGVQHHTNSLAINPYAQKWWGAGNNFATRLRIYDMKYSNTSRTRSYAGIQYAFKCQDSCCTGTSGLPSFPSITKEETLISLLLALNV